MMKAAAVEALLHRMGRSRPGLGSWAEHQRFDPKRVRRKLVETGDEPGDNRKQNDGQHDLRNSGDENRQINYGTGKNHCKQAIEHDHKTGA